jgi:hypothetical protein
MIEMINPSGRVVEIGKNVILRDGELLMFREEISNEVR